VAASGDGNFTLLGAAASRAGGERPSSGLAGEDVPKRGDTGDNGSWMLIPVRKGLTSGLVSG
jgi:hypothetical protein